MLLWHEALRLVKRMKRVCTYMLRLDLRFY
jgi:hypothetical protein